MSLENENSGYDAVFRVGGAQEIEDTERRQEDLREFASDLTAEIIECRKTSGLNDPEFRDLREAQNARDEHIRQIVSAFMQINQAEIGNSTDQDAILAYIRSATTSSTDNRSFLLQIEHEGQGEENSSADERDYWASEGLVLRHFVGSYGERAIPDFLVPQGKTFSDEGQKNAFIAQRADKYLPVYNIIHAWSDGLAENSGALGKMGQLDQRNTQEFKQLTGISLQANEPTRSKNLDGARQEQLENQYLRQFALASVFRAKINREKSYRQRRGEIKNIEADLADKRERLDLLQTTLVRSQEQNPVAQKRQKVRESIIALASGAGIDLQDFGGTTNALLNSAIESLQRRKHDLKPEATQGRTPPRGFLAIAVRPSDPKMMEIQTEAEKINGLIEKIKSFREDAREMLSAEMKQDGTVEPAELPENLQKAITDLETQIDALDTQFQKLRNTQENGFRHFFGNALSPITNKLWELETGRIDLESYQTSVGEYIDQINSAVRESRVWIDEDFGDVPRQDAEEFIHLAQMTNWYNPDDARETVAQYKKFRNNRPAEGELGSILAQFDK